MTQDTKKFILDEGVAASISERVATYVLEIADRYGLTLADDWQPKVQWSEEHNTIVVVQTFSVDFALIYHCILSILRIRPKLNLTVDGANELGLVADILIPHDLIPELIQQTERTE